MGIYEMFVLGMLTALWDWSNESVTLFAYICFAVGVIIQIILEIKCRNSKLKWTFIVVSCINMVLCELILLGITEFIRFGIELIYAAIINILYGEIIVKVIFAIKKRIKKA